MESTQEEAEQNKEMSAEGAEAQTQEQTPEGTPQADADTHHDGAEEEKVGEEEKVEEEEKVGEEEKVEEDTDVLWDKTRKREIMEDLQKATDNLASVAEPLDLEGYRTTELIVTLDQVPFDRNTFWNG